MVLPTSFAGLTLRLSVELANLLLANFYARPGSVACTTLQPLGQFKSGLRPILANSIGRKNAAVHGDVNSSRQTH